MYFCFVSFYLQLQNAESLKVYGVSRKKYLSSIIPKKKKFKHVFLNVPMRTTHNSTTKNNNSMLHLNSVLSKVVALVLKVSTSNIDIFYRKQTRGAEQLVLKCIAEFLQICRHLSLFYCVRGYSFWATKA
jgi:hypothetical protein